MGARYRPGLAALVLCLTVSAGCSSGDRPTAAATPPATTAAASAPTTTMQLTGPLHDPDRITADDRVAIEAIGASAAGEPAHAHGHSQVPVTIAVPFFTGDGAMFNDQ